MMTSTRCLVKVLFTAAFLAVLVPKSCCKSIEEIETVDDEISDHEKLRESGIEQMPSRNRRDTDLTDEVSLANEDGWGKIKRLSEDENEKVVKRGFRFGRRRGSRRSRRSSRSRRSRRFSRRRRSRRTSRRSRGRRTRRRQRFGRRRSRRNGRHGFDMDHVQTGLDLVNTGMGVADHVNGWRNRRR
ncbi:uncharacterized protein LOC111128607 [Crassostrea virginica]